MLGICRPQYVFHVVPQRGWFLLEPHSLTKSQTHPNSHDHKHFIPLYDVRSQMDLLRIKWILQDA